MHTPPSPASAVLRPHLSTHLSTNLQSSRSTCRIPFFPTNTASHPYSPLPPPQFQSSNDILFRAPPYPGKAYGGFLPYICLALRTSYQRKISTDMHAEVFKRNSPWKWNNGRGALLWAGNYQALLGLLECNEAVIFWCKEPRVDGGLRAW